jgi:mannose-1-phosphate guanylyltransferase
MVGFSLLESHLREKSSVTESWCVLLASRQSLQRPVVTERECDAAQRRPTQIMQDHSTAALRRAGSVAPRDKIAAVIAAPPECWRECSLEDLDVRNLFVQPRHQGTAYEVLFALLQLEARISPKTPVLFLPTDHVVRNEEVMTRALMSMVEWTIKEPQPVYLLGAVPQGPHDQLGYIVPWHDAMQMPTSIYEFVERPEVRQARKLINAGGLWNTFIFGGTLISLIELFPRRFAAAIAALRSALRADSDQPDALVHIYNRLTTVDFSQNVLATQTDRLHVLRLPSCGWWPLQSPKLNQQIRPAAPAAL